MNRLVLFRGLSAYSFMYHSKIDEIDKKEIMESFSKGGVCRILFCTTAFGMGVDVADIRRCIHFGPPQDIDDYLQESGRTGRDGLSSSAVIYAYPGYLIGHVSKAMKEYCKSAGECRRELLLQHFECTLGYQLQQASSFT